MFDAEDELRQRRVRATIAQRRFRQRQTAANQKIKTDCERLKSIVTDIVEASRREDSAGLKHAIGKAAKVIEVDVEETLDAEVSEQISEKVVLRSPLPELEDPPDLDHSSMQAQICIRRSGRVSPRLDYGVLPSLSWSSLPTSQPPPDIAPFVGTGEHTVAGQISWACLEYGYSCLQVELQADALEDVPGKEGCPPVSRREARRMFDVALRHSKALHNLRYMKMLLAARIEFRRPRYIRTDLESSRQETEQLLGRIVRDDMVRQGVNMSQWWTASQIEDYMAMSMGPAAFAALHVGLMYWDKHKTESLRPLTYRLARESVCFGDGPRWRAEHVVFLADTWIAQMCR